MQVNRQGPFRMLAAISIVIVNLFNNRRTPAVSFEPFANRFVPAVDNDKRVRVNTGYDAFKRVDLRACDGTVQCRVQMALVVAFYLPPGPPRRNSPASAWLI